MTVESCIPVIPSADLKKSLRFWVEGFGLTMDREMRHEGKLMKKLGVASKSFFIFDNAIFDVVRKGERKWVASPGCRENLL